MSSLKQTPLTCSGHTRPVVYLSFSDITPFGYFLISASKGKGYKQLWHTILRKCITVFGQSFYSDEHIF